MNLRGFSLNDPEVIPKSDQETVVKQSLLGLIWDGKDDTLRTQLKAFEGGMKQELAQFTASHFDLLGLLSSIFIPWKVFCQAL